jgi:large subunit ribosomal protein L18
MAFRTDRKTLARQARHRRVRKTVVGISGRPRMVVFRSNRHIYAQVIDDLKGVTLAAASTLDKELGSPRPTRNAAAAVGSLLAKRALAKQVRAVVFDRGGYLYHGQVKALADAARAAGLTF